MDVCRLCATTNKPRFSVLETEALGKKILQCLSIEISETDTSLPTNICGDCKKKVESFHAYKEACLQTQKTLAQKKCATPPSVSLIVTTADGPLTVPLHSHDMEMLSTHYNLPIPQSVVTKSPTKISKSEEVIEISDSDEEAASTKNEHMGARCSVELSVRVLHNIERSHSSSPRRRVRGNIVFFCKFCKNHSDTREEMARHFLIKHDIQYDALTTNNCHHELNLLYYEVDGIDFNSMQCKECAIQYPNIKAFKIHYFKYHQIRK